MAICMNSRLFGPSFSEFRVDAGDAAFAGAIGGNGPAVVLLHGYPQTHATWRKVAPKLAEHHTVIVPDLPGYGDSRTKEIGARWTKRRVASAIVGLLASMGHSRFAVVGHDRGARVGYRLALDHPGRVAGFASLAVVPTLDVWPGVDMTFAMNAFHWFMLAQPFDIPERLLAGDPDAFIDATLTRMAGSLERLDSDLVDAYRRAFREPSVRHAMCEDYRAAAEEDVDHDASDRSMDASWHAPCSRYGRNRARLPSRLLSKSGVAGRMTSVAAQSTAAICCPSWPRRTC